MNIAITISDVEPEDLPSIVEALHAKRGSLIAAVVEERGEEAAVEDELAPPADEDELAPPEDDCAEELERQQMDGDLEPPADVELDANGLPWDKRIHSSGKSKMKTGKNKGWWTLKRGIKRPELTAVVDELRVLYPEPEAKAETPAEEVDGATADAMALLGGGTEAPTVSYADVLGKITQGVGVDKTLLAPEVNKLLAKHGLADLSELQAHPDKLGAIDTALNEMLAA